VSWLGYTYRSTGRYKDGRRVWVWARAGRWWVHLEVGSRCLHAGQERWRP
jgi:hypothetical protein